MGGIPWGAWNTGFLALKHSDCRIHHEIKEQISIFPKLSLNDYQLFFLKKIFPKQSDRG